jgi:hypothetical protein
VNDGNLLQGEFFFNLKINGLSVAPVSKVYIFDKTFTYWHNNSKLAVGKKFLCSLDFSLQPIWSGMNFSFPTVVQQSILKDF